MNPLDMGNALFEDVGDKIAKELGMPTYTN
jgi:hypothetical protein